MRGAHLYGLEALRCALRVALQPAVVLLQLRAVLCGLLVQLVYPRYLREPVLLEPALMPFPLLWVSKLSGE